MEMFVTQNQNHMGATAGQNFNALGGKFYDVTAGTACWAEVV